MLQYVGAYNKNKKNDTTCIRAYRDFHTEIVVGDLNASLSVSPLFGTVANSLSCKSLSYMPYPVHRAEQVYFQ